MLDHIGYFKLSIQDIVWHQIDSMMKLKKKPKCIETIPVPSSVGAEVFMTVL